MQKQTHQQHGDYICVANMQAQESANTLYRVTDFTRTSRLKLNALLGRRRRREAPPRPKRSAREARASRRRPIEVAALRAAGQAKNKEPIDMIL